MTDTPIADMVAKMLSTGIPPDAIIMAIATAEQCSKQPIDPTAEKRRAWDRERKAKQRVHRNSADPPHIETPPKKIDSKNLSMPIPENFECDLKYATDRGWSLARAQSEACRFRDDALAKGRKYRNWPAAWRNWVTSPYQNHSSRPNGEHHDPFERRNGESLGDLARRLADEARRREAMAGIEEPTLPLASG